MGTQAPGAAGQGIVVVIGAGVAGLQAVHALTKAGIPVTCLELQDRVGGVWTRETHGYTLQVPWQMYQFPEFPWPANLTPKAQSATSQELAAYLQAYAQHFDLMRHVRLRSKVLQVALSNGGTSDRRWVVLYEDTESGAQYVLRASWLLLCTGQMATPFVPQYKGQELFQGAMLHSAEVADLRVFKDKRVVVVGSGKTGLDLVAEMGAASQARSVTLVYRTSHWCLPRKLKGQPVGDFLFSRHTAQQLPPYYTHMDAAPGCGHTSTSPFMACLPCGAPFHAGDDGPAGTTASAAAGSSPPCRMLTARQAAFWAEVANAARGDLQTPKLVPPNVDLLQDLFNCTQIFDAGWCEFMRSDKVQAHHGTIAHMGPRAVTLHDGTELPCDVLLCCTGFHNDYKYLDDATAAALNVSPDGLYLYRSIIPPGVPNMAFLGSEVSTFNQLMTSYLQVQWFVRVLAGCISLPSPVDMHADVLKQQAWRRRIMPAARNRANVYMVYQQHYFDQLVTDMGEQTRRKPWWKPGAEQRRAYTPADYQHLLARAPEAPRDAKQTMERMDGEHVPEVVADKLRKSASGGALCSSPGTAVHRSAETRGASGFGGSGSLAGVAGPAILAPASAQDIEDILLSTEPDAPFAKAPSARSTGSPARLPAGSPAGDLVKALWGTSHEQRGKAKSSTHTTVACTATAVGAQQPSAIRTAASHGPVSAPGMVEVVNVWTTGALVPDGQRAVAQPSSGPVAEGLEGVTEDSEATAASSGSGRAHINPAGSGASTRAVSGTAPAVSELRRAHHKLGGSLRDSFRRWSHERAQKEKHSAAAAAAQAAGRASLDTARAQWELAAQAAEQLRHPSLAAHSNSSSRQGVPAGGELPEDHAVAGSKPRVSHSGVFKQWLTNRSSGGPSSAVGAPGPSRTKQLLNLLTGNSGASGNKSVKAGTTAVPALDMSAGRAESAPPHDGALVATSFDEAVAAAALERGAGSSPAAVGGHGPQQGPVRTPFLMQAHDQQDAAGSGAGMSTMHPPREHSLPLQDYGPQSVASVSVHDWMPSKERAAAGPSSSRALLSAATSGHNSSQVHSSSSAGYAQAPTGPASLGRQAQPRQPVPAAAAAAAGAALGAAAASPGLSSISKPGSAQVQLMALGQRGAGAASGSPHPDAGSSAATGSGLMLKLSALPSGAAVGSVGPSASWWAAASQVAAVAAAQSGNYDPLQHVAAVLGPRAAVASRMMMDMDEVVSDDRREESLQEAVRQEQRDSDEALAAAAAAAERHSGMVSASSQDPEGLHALQRDSGCSSSNLLRRLSGRLVSAAQAHASPCITSQLLLAHDSKSPSHEDLGAFGAGLEGAEYHPLPGPLEHSGSHSSSSQLAEALGHARGSRGSAASQQATLPDGQPSPPVSALAVTTVSPPGTVSLNHLVAPSVGASMDPALEPLGPSADADVWAGEWASVTSNVLHRLGVGAGADVMLSGPNTQDGGLHTSQSNVLRRLSWRLGQGHTGTLSFASGSNALGSLEAPGPAPLMMLYTPIMSALLQARASAPVHASSGQNALPSDEQAVSSTSDNDKVAPLPDLSISRSYLSLGAAASSSGGAARSQLHVGVAAHLQQAQQRLPQRLAAAGMAGHQPGLRTRAKSFSASLPGVAPRSMGALGSHSAHSTHLGGAPRAASLRHPHSASRLGPSHSLASQSRLSSSTAMYSSADAAPLLLPGHIRTPQASLHDGMAGLGTAVPGMPSNVAALMAARRSQGGGYAAPAVGREGDLGAVLVSDYMLLLRELGVLTDALPILAPNAALAPAGGSPTSPVTPVIKGWAPIVPSGIAAAAAAGARSRSRRASATAVDAGKAVLPPGGFAILPAPAAGRLLPLDDAAGGGVSEALFFPGDADRVANSNALLRLSGRVVPSGFNAVEGFGGAGLGNPSACYLDSLSSKELLVRLSGRVLPSETGFAHTEGDAPGRYTTNNEALHGGFDELDVDQMLKDAMQLEAWDARYLPLSAPMQSNMRRWSTAAAAYGPSSTTTQAAQVPQQQQQRVAAVGDGAASGAAAVSVCDAGDLHRRLCDALMARGVVKGLLAELNQLPERVVAAAAARGIVDSSPTNVVPPGSSGGGAGVVSAGGETTRPSLVSDPVGLEAFREALQADISQLPHRLAAALAPSLLAAPGPRPASPQLLPTFHMGAAAPTEAGAPPFGHAWALDTGGMEEESGLVLDSTRLFTRLEGRVATTPLQSGSNALGSEVGDARLGGSSIAGTERKASVLSAAAGPALPGTMAVTAGTTESGHPMGLVLEDVVTMMSHISEGHGDERVWADQVIAQLLLQDMVRLPDRLLAHVAHSRAGGVAPSSLGDNSGAYTHKSGTPRTPHAASPSPQPAGAVAGEAWAGGRADAHPAHDEILDLLLLARDNILALSVYMGSQDLGGPSGSCMPTMLGSSSGAQLNSMRSMQPRGLQRLVGRVVPSGPASRRGSVVVLTPARQHSASPSPGPSPVSG